MAEQENQPYQVGVGNNLSVEDFKRSIQDRKPSEVIMMDDSPNARKCVELAKELGLTTRR